MSLNELFAKAAKVQGKTRSLSEYLENWANDPVLSRNAAGRVLHAIGDPEYDDTTRNPRRAIMFSNRTIKVYPAFADLIGVEPTVERLVQYFKMASQGAEQKKQILCIVGPVGAGKSKLIERVKRLYENEPMQVLGFKDTDDSVQLSPVLEHPFGLFDRYRHGDLLESKYGIPQEALECPMSSWAQSRLESSGNYDRFVVVEVWPSMASGRGICRRESGDNKSVDVNSLIGVYDRDRKEYEYSGALNTTTQGLFEFVEMFKTSSKVLHSFLGVTQDRKYAGHGSVGELPYQGIVMTYANEEDWNAFKKNETYKAHVDRVVPIEMPYGLSMSDEVKIYRQHLTGLKTAPVVPGSLEVAARFSVVTRLNKVQHDLRLHVYDGRFPENCSADDRKKTADALRSEAKDREGMTGASRRLMLKYLPIFADHDPAETALDPVTVFEELKRMVAREELPAFAGRTPAVILKEDVEAFVKTTVRQLIMKAYIGDYDTYLDRHFKEYVVYLDSWVEEQEYKEPESGTILTLAELDRRLARRDQSVPSGARGTFRKDLLKAILTHYSKPATASLRLWPALDPDVREKLEPAFEPGGSDVAEVIRFVERKTAKEKEEHEAFLQRFYAMGITKNQARRMIEWYLDPKSYR